MTRLLVLLFLALGLPANAADWELQSNKGGIAVYTARVPGQELRAFRGVTVLPAPARSVLALLADVENMPSWFFHMKSARELDPSAGHYGHNHYLVIAGIWPVHDRDVAIRASTSQQADGVIVMSSVAQANLLAVQSCCVRIPRMESTWTVRALDAGHTELVLTTSSHPGGSLPLWIANMVAADMPRKTLEAVRREVKKPAYAEVDTQGSAKGREFVGRFKL